MDTRDFENIDQFLSLAGQPDLWEYYGLPSDATEDVVDATVRKRRSWAQGQQSNPKYRSEALWVIKNMSLVRRALIEEREEYAAEVARQLQSRNLDKLTPFVEGVLADGILNPQREATILEQGGRLGLPADLVKGHIAHILQERGLARAADEGDSERVSDYYELLGVPADVPMDELESAYRQKYRWARSLSDTSRSSEIYAQLDEAWRILRDEDRRREYDDRRRSWMESVERRAAGDGGEFIGFLPPPEKRRTAPAPPRPAEQPPPAVERAPEPPRVMERVPEHHPTQSPPAVSGSMEMEPLVLPQTARVSHDAPPVQQVPPSHRTLPPAVTIPPAVTDAPPPKTRPPLPPPVLPPPAVAPSSATPAPPPRAPPPPVAPRPPDSLRDQKTLDLKPGASTSRRQRAPKLEIDGPEVHKLRVGHQPAAIQFLVRNVGQGQMAGRVLSDREWVQVSPTRLDPLKREQVVEARVLGRQMPRRKAISLVTVVADHGERRSVTIDVERQVVNPVALAAAALVVLLLMLIVLLVLL